jgi:hypothetical protein
MHEYDAALKSVLTRVGGTVLTELTGFTVTRWHNAELPAVRHRRADLLGETDAGELVHVELQSTNHLHMARRMLEYGLAIERKFDRFPAQVVLYVGEAPLRMSGLLVRRKLKFECSMVDIRDFDGERWLESESLADNVMAVLMRFRNEREAVRRILARIALAAPEARESALGELLILVSLRKLEVVIEQEIDRMPLRNDIRAHPIVKREQRMLICDQIAKKFGPAPDWALERLEKMSWRDLRKTALRLLDVDNLQELFN